MNFKLAVTALLVAGTVIAVIELNGESSSAGVFPGGNGKIVFESSAGADNEVISIKADGSGRVSLMNNTINDGTASFSSDGERIVFMRDGIISVMKANGSNVTPLGVTTGDDPSFSPNGRQIVFSNNDGGGDLEINVMNADGSNSHALTDNAVTDAEPSWSPDGRRIAFVREGGAGGEIFVMNANGSGQVPLTMNAVDDSEPSWSPDGQKVLFVRADGDPEIFTMNSTGANQSPLTNNALTDEDPVFAPNGRKVLFVRNDGTDPELFLMNADGSNQVQLTDDTVTEEDPDWQALNAPACRLSGKKAQNSFRFVKVKITCSEDASVKLKGTVRAPLKGQRFALRPLKLKVQPRVTKVARIVVPKRARQAIRKAVEAGETSKARVGAIATDDLGLKGRATKAYTFN